MDDPTFDLRPATGADTEFLLDMLVEAVNWSPDRPAISREQILADRRTAHYIAQWPRPSDLGVVAVDRAGRPIGAAWLRRFDRHDPGYGFVEPDVPELSIGVVADWRGRGVGRALLRAAARRAAEAGVDRVSLSVERANPARHLYVSEGFETVASDASADTMVKALDLPP